MSGGHVKVGFTNPSAKSDYVPDGLEGVVRWLIEHGEAGAGLDVLDAAVRITGSVKGTRLSLEKLGNYARTRAAELGVGS